MQRKSARFGVHFRQRCEPAHQGWISCDTVRAFLVERQISVLRNWEPFYQIVYLGVPDSLKQGQQCGINRDNRMKYWNFLVAHQDSLIVS